MHRNGTVDETGRNRTGDLTPKQEGIAVLLAAGSSVQAAAKKGGVSLSQIWAWKKDEPAFDARVRQLRAEMTSRAVGLAVDAMADAVIALRRLLKSESEPMRHRAAESLLTHGSQLSALAELQDRVAALEGGRRR